MSAWVLTVAILVLSNGELTQLEETRQVNSLVECRAAASEIARNIWTQMNVYGVFITCEPATET